jgi:hypothetical protein
MFAAQRPERNDNQRKLERLLVDAIGRGGTAVRAIADIRDLLRLGIPNIDAIEAEYLPGLVQRILEQLQAPTVIEDVFSGAVKCALEEAQTRADDLAFNDAAHVLAAQVAQIESENCERDAGLTALLAKSGWVASLRLRYREAAAFHARAGLRSGFGLGPCPCGSGSTYRSRHRVR